MELDPRLFWDSDPSKIDYERHVRHIIERVVTRGTLEEWRTIVRYYGKERIKEEAVQIRDLDPKSLAFLSVVLRTPISEFRCYTQQLLNPTPSPY